VGVSAATTLWSASRGIYGLLTGLNAIYQVPENRGYFQTRLISVLYTFLFLVVLLLTLVLHVFGTDLLHLLSQSQLPVLRFLTRVVDLRFFLLVFLQTALFTAMFMVLPNRKNSLGDSLPGAFLASIGWLIFSHLFSLYVESVPDYASVYGSVYALALSMLWLYFCIGIVFYGGVLNCLLMAQADD
jgi:membrane protein